MRRQKSKRTTQVILVSFIAFIMIASVIGFIWDGSQKIKYNGFSFENNGNSYTSVINKKQFSFNFLPQDVEYISIDNEIASRISDAVQIDTTSDINDTNKDIIALAQYNINQVLIENSIYLRQGFTANNTFNLPIITCNDATANVPVLYFKTSGQNMISSENNCIIIEAEEAIDFIQVKDRLLYSMLGVIR